MNKRVLAYGISVILTAMICFGASQMQLINTTAPGDSLKVGGGKMNTNALILETNIITMSNQLFIGSNIFGLVRTNNLKEGANVTITVDATNGVTIGMASVSNSGIAVLNGSGTNLTVWGTLTSTNLADMLLSVSNAVIGQIPSTNYFAQTSYVASYVQSATNTIAGLIPSTNYFAQTSYVASAIQSATNSLATTSYVASATNTIAGLIPSTNGFVNSTITNGLAATNYTGFIRSDEGLGTNVTLYGTENFALELTTGTLTVTNSNSLIPSYLKTNQVLQGSNVTITQNGDNTITIGATAGSVDTNTVIASGYGLGTNTTLHGMISVVNTAAVNEAIFTNGVTIGGERRTTWPTGGTGGPVSSLTNVTMYQQVYYSTATNDPTSTQIFISLTNAETVLVLTNTILSTNISIFTTNQWASTNGTLYANVMLTQSLTNSIALSFPSQWKWQGVSAPTALASNAVALLSLKKYITSGDTIETNIIAGYNVTP